MILVINPLAGIAVAVRGPLRPDHAGVRVAGERVGTQT